MIAWYRKLLCLYPAEYRKRFSEEMLAVLFQEREENAKRRLKNRARVVVRETAGLLRGALN